MTDLAEQNGRLATIFGGSGFIGRHVARALALQGWRIRIACRRPDLAYFLQPLGGVGQIHAVQANIREPESIEAALRDADAVVNLVGILEQSGKQTFADLHHNAAGLIARAAADKNIRNYVHMSALGADMSSPCEYHRTKNEGERAVRAAQPQAAILRPSIVFGPEDAFLNRFAAIARFSPIAPVVGAKSKLQPVFVGDVAKAVALALNGAARPGATYELGGPEVMTMREIVEWTIAETQRRRIIAPVSIAIGEVMGLVSETLSALTLGMYPPLLKLTRDQVMMAQHDYVVSAQAKADGLTLEALGVTPTSHRCVAPVYLYRYRAKGQYQLSRL